MYWDFSENEDYVIEKTTGAVLSLETMRKYPLQQVNAKTGQIDTVHPTTAEYMEGIDDFIEHVVDYCVMFRFSGFNGKDLELLRLALYDLILDSYRGQMYLEDPEKYPMEKKVYH